jgi:hypothetical protein
MNHWERRASFKENQKNRKVSLDHFSASTTTAERVLGLMAKNRHNEHGQTEPDSSKKNACLQPQTVFNWIMSRAESIPTRASLLERLKNADDHSSWTRF